MSQIQVDNIYNKEGTGSPSFPLGANVTGVITATSFSGSGANLTGIDATALKDSNGTVRVQANTTGAVITGNVSVGGTLTYEDVTNVDSVGVITARDGIKVTGGDVQVGTATTIDNSGINVTGVVTATSFSGSGANITGIDPAPTVQATADGAIAAGDPVIVKSDGDVTKVVQTVAVNNPPAAGSAALIATDNLRRPAACYVPDGNKVVAAAHNASSSNPLAYNVGDVTDAGAITWGASWPNIDTENIQAMPGLCYDTTNDKVVVLYYASTSNKIWSRVGTISGTNISWGTAVEVYGADSNNFRCQRLIFDPTNSKVIALYRRGGGNNPNARVGTVSGTSISWGTESAMNNVESDQMDMTYDPDTQRIIAISKAQSGSEASCHVGTVSGTDITWGANNSIDAGQPSYYPTVAYDTKNNKVVVQYETNSNVTKYKVGTVTGGSTNTIAWSSAGDVVTSDVNNQEIFFDAFSERLVSFYRDNSSDVYVGSGSLSGSTITWSSFYKIDDEGVPNEYFTGVILQNGIVASIAQDGDVSSDLYSRTAILGTSSSNATTDNFIGFARDAAANDATAKIDISGAVNASQSGLTAGEKYYVQKNGSLATTEDTPKVFAGTAISASKLIVNDQQPVPTIPTTINYGWELIKGGTHSWAHNDSGVIIEDLDTTYAAYDWWKFLTVHQAGTSNTTVDYELGIQMKQNGSWQTNSYIYQHHTGSNGSDRTAGRGGGMNRVSFSWMSGANYNTEAVLYGAQNSTIPKYWRLQIVGFRNNWASNVDMNVTNLLQGRNDTNVIQGFRWKNYCSSGNAGIFYWQLFGMKKGTTND